MRARRQNLNLRAARLKDRLLGYDFTQLFFGGTILFSLISLWLLIAGNQQIRGYILFNSDAITPAVFYRSLFERDDPLAGFRFATQNFAFPTMVLFGVSY